MNTLLSSALAQLLPSYLLFYLGAETYLRNRRSRVNLMAMLLMILHGIIFIGQFLMAELQPGDALEAMRWFFYLPAFATMSLGLFFYREISGYGTTPRLEAGLCLLPLSGAAVTIFFPSWARIGLLEKNGLREGTYSAAYAVLLAVGCSLLLIGMFVFLRRAYMKAARENSVMKERYRIRTLLRGCLLASAFIVCSVAVNVVLSAHGIYSWSGLPTLGILIWAIFVRHAMVKYDFLASADRRYELLFKMSQNGIVLVDQEGRILEANRAFRAVSGMTEDDRLEGASVFSLVTEADREYVRTQYASYFSRMKPIHTELTVNNAQGNLIIVEIDSDYIEMNAQLCCFIVARDVTQQKRNERKLEELAYQDPLTGLGNRRYFIDRLEETLGQMRRSGGEVGVMMLDLDQFKWVNDTLGHTAGDMLLRQMAEKLAGALPSGAVISRIGGDEFAIILNAPAVDVIYCAQSLTAVMKEPLVVEGRPFVMTASIGVSVAPQDGSDVETLIRNADTAMYVAKTSGRHQYHLFTPQLRMKADQHLTILSGLAQALEREEFLVHYQPQIDLRTGTICGVEALLRWNSRELGWISPCAFIPIAEETGMIVPIGSWVLRTAIAQTKRWVEDGHQEIIVSVNLSARQLREPLLAQEIAGLLEEFELSPRNLCLEITESTAISDVETSYAVCKELADMGIMLAVDDFGMGYSSISMLNRFPFHYTKIDRSLVQDIVTNKRDLAVVRAVIKLSNDLGMQTIAEGVETAEQQDMLRALHCHEAQGYLYGKPMEVGQVTAFLHDRRDVKLFNKGSA